jgi:hypothetical protein
MREKIQMYICLQLSVFLHYSLLTSVAAEVQGQSIRANKHTLVRALNQARRAGINVAEYQRRLGLAPLTVAYENRIDFGQPIERELKAISAQLQSDLQSRADWKIYRLHDAAVLIVDTSDPQLLDSWIFVYPDGRTDTTVEYPIRGPQQPAEAPLSQLPDREAGQIERLCRTGHIPIASARALFALTANGRLENLGKIKAPEVGSQAAVYVDFKGQTSANLLAGNSPSDKTLLASVRLISQAARASR